MQFKQDTQMVRKGKGIYQKRLKTMLEKDPRGEIVAIEVESGDYFLGKTVIEAADKGKNIQKKDSISLESDIKLFIL